MKKKRVLWSVLFAVCFAMFGLSASAEGDSYPQSEWTDAKYFEFDASTGTILKYSLDGPKDVIIPAEIHGVAVRYIGERAFCKWSSELQKNLYEIRNVQFPEGLISIGDWAFERNQLTQVKFPEGLTSIGYSAFERNQLTQVEFPKGLTYIKYSAFYGNQLTQVQFPDSLTSIEGSAFGKNQLTQVQFPQGLTSIGVGAFRDNQLTQVKLPERLTHIGEWAFADNQLTQVHFPDGLTSIGHRAFEKNQLTQVSFPQGLTSIGIAAFYSNQLTQVHFPDSLTSIGNGAFYKNQLTQVHFPDSLRKIEDEAFRSNQLTEVEVPEACWVHPEAFDKEVKIIRRGGGYVPEEGLKNIILGTPSGDIEVKWGKELFQNSSFTYNNDLALVCAALSDAAETPVGSKIVQAYRDLGFEEDNIFLYSYPGNSKNRSQYKWAKDNVLAFSIAHRNFGDEVLLTFCLRGTVTDGDIGKDLNAGWIGTDFFGVRAHNGFYDFYEDAFERGLPDYLKEHPEIEKAKRERKLKILVTGHSLGGAGANLLGASLNRKESDWSDKSNTFVYTFATPNVYSKDKAIFGNDNLEKQGNENIFNIVNKKDFVIYMPTLGFFGHLTPENESIDSMRWKFGRRLGFYFDDAPSGKVDLKNDESRNRAINQHHIMKHYIRAINPGALKELGTIDSREVVVAVHCPVDVEVVNKDGTVVARVVNDEIDESVTEIMTVVDGDKKYFWFDDSTDYTLRVIGNDNGKMDMAVVREDLSTNKVTGASIFKNVEIVKDKKMEGTVSKDAAPTEPTIKLYTLDKNDVPMKEIQSDGKEKENLFAEKVISDPNYSWTVTFNGALDPSAVNAQNFFIQDAAGNILTGIEPTLVDGTKVRFENHTTFEKNKDYYLVVKKDVRGQGNTKLKKTVILKFRVE